MQKTITLIAILFLGTIKFNSVFSQVPNGPGGISNTTGAGSLLLWLDAGDLNADGNYSNNPGNGVAVSTWSDKSGYAYDLSNATVAQQPSYNTTGTYNSVNFSTPSSGTAIKTISNATAVSLTPGSVFIVLDGTSGGNVDNVLFDDGTNSLRYEQYPTTGQVGYTRYGVSDYSSGFSTPYGAYNVISYHKPASSNNLTIGVGSGNTIVNIGSTTAGLPISRIGTTSNSVDRANYNLVEVVAHNTMVTTAQRVIIENYLSAKYGSFAIPNDVYTMDDPANGNYDYNVAGIGKESNGTQTDSRGTGIIEITGATFSGGNGRYFMWGDDNGAAVANNTSDIPAVLNARMSRIWRVNNTGNKITNMTMLVDLSNLGPVTASDLRLLVDENNNGVFADETTGGGGVIGGFTHVSGNSYQVTGVTITDGLRFTIGTINSSQTPLPITFIAFNANLNSTKQVDLTWTTATETNNNYFTIEKSNDGLNFEYAGKVNGAGNSTTPVNYEFTDSSPFSGTSYYKLTQTDFEGTSTSISKIVSVDVYHEESFEVYPNPSSGDNLQMKFSGDIANKEILVVLYDPHGTEIYTKVILTGMSNELIEAIDPSNKLPPGVYLIIATSENKVYNQKIIIL